MKNKVIAMTVLLFMSTTLHAEPITYGPRDSKIRILLAWENTKFKEKLIQKMVETLNDGKTYIKVVDHQKGELAGEKAQDYSAVFISNSGVKSMVRPWITEWIGQQNKKDNILLHTTQKAYWEVKAGVDTVTSASAPQAIDVLSRKYLDKISKIINPQ